MNTVNVQLDGETEEPYKRDQIIPVISKPEDSEIIQVLMRFYSVDEKTVIDWIKQIDFKKLAA